MTGNDTKAAAGQRHPPSSASWYDLDAPAELRWNCPRLRLRPSSTSSAAASTTSTSDSAAAMPRSTDDSYCVKIAAVKVSYRISATPPKSLSA